MNILLPKAAQEQARWQQALLECGVEGQLCDPWQIDRVPEDASQRNTWLNLDQFKAVICVSPTAAQVLCESLDQYWPMPPADVYWICNGPRTASTLQSAGLPVIFPDSGYTAEDVLKLPQSQIQTGDKWLIVKGNGGRVTLAEELTRRGADITELPVYTRSVNAQVLDRMVTLAAGCDALWLSSQYLGERLLEQNESFWHAWPGQWWVSSERLKKWAEQHRLSTVRVSSGATLDAFKSMLPGSGNIVT